LRGPAALLVAALAAPAVAAPASQPLDARVLLVSMRVCCQTEAWLEAEEAARAELVGMGIAVQVVSGVAMGERERRLELNELTASHHAATGLRIVRVNGISKAAVEIWLEDLVTGRTIVRRVSIGAAGDVVAARIAALKTVEAVSLTMRELGGSPMPAVRAAPAPPPPSPPAPPERFAVRLSGGGLGGPGGVGGVGALQVGVRLALRGPWALAVEGAVSAGGARVTSGFASASADLALVRAWFSWSPTLGRVRPGIGAGIGVAIPWAVGESTPGMTGRTDSTAVAYAGGGGEVTLALTRWLQLRLDARIGVLTPEVRVRFADTVAARLGRPLAEGWLGLEARLP
jgi:hypothetical protein